MLCQLSLRVVLVDVRSSTNQLNTEGLCKLSKHLWQDSKSDEHSTDSPIFRLKNITESDSRDCQKTSEWAKKDLQGKTVKMVGGGNIQTSSRSYGAGRAANKVHKRLLQLSEVQEIHSLMKESSNEFPIHKCNTLMDMYVKCGSMVDACHVFDDMPNRNVVSWNIMILGYAKHEKGALALEMYARMYKEGVQPSDRTFVSVLKACCSLAELELGIQAYGRIVKMDCLEKGRAIHSQVVKSGFESDVFVGTALLDLYTRCGSMEDAWCVFDKLPDRDSVSWTAMISAYAQMEEGELALDLFARMHQEDVIPDHRTFVASLKACVSLAAKEEGTNVDGNIEIFGCLEKGRVIHSQILKKGFESNVFVGTSLVGLYAKCGDMEDAWHAFSQLPYRDVVSWTAMISGYAQREEGTRALELYAHMYQEGVPPDPRTFVGALKACSSLAAEEEGVQVNERCVKVGCLEKGRTIHSQAVMWGFESGTFVGTILVDMYAKCGSMEDALHVFTELPHRDVVSWTAMVLGYALKEEGVLALDVYAQMREEGILPDRRTFVGVLKACSSLTGLEEGREVDGKLVKLCCLEKDRTIHSHAVNHGFETDAYVGTSLVDAYVKCGAIEDARYVFDELPHRNAVSWTAMIWGYAEQEESAEAFKLYAQMQEEGPSPNSFTYVSILKACSNTTALETGKELHIQICRVGLETATIVANTLIDMYAKCGSMVDAQQMFDALPTRSSVTWNALIAGYARQGESKLVFDLFNRMTQEGIQPSSVTFLSLLTACSHAGILEKGQQYFQAMNDRYGIIPTIEHYTCMIDLLGRAGQVEEALAMVEKMPCQPDAVSLVTLLGACQNGKNTEAGRHVFEYAMRLDKNNSAAYVLLSNIYAHAFK